MIITRRGFMGLILASAAAPAIVRAQSIMPLKFVISPPLKFGWSGWIAGSTFASENAFSLWSIEHTSDFIRESNSFSDRGYYLDPSVLE